MKITVMNLDRLFFQEFRITDMHRIDRIMGYCGEHLYIHTESEHNDSSELKDAIHQITSLHYKKDWKDAAVILFKLLFKLVGGKKDKETWKITNK